MPVRRPLALTASALLLAVPALSSCGFNYATDRVNTITNGVSERSASVDVLNAVIVAAQPDSGTLVALLSNNTQEPRTLVGIRGDDDESVEVSETEVGLFPRASANLANEQAPISVTGEFEPGEFIDMIFSFDTGEEVDVAVQVVLACEEYEGLDVTAELKGEAGGGAVIKTEGDKYSETEQYSCDYPEREEK